MKRLVYSVFRESGGQVGGYADRLKGIASTYALSVILGRKFQVCWSDGERAMGLIPVDPALIINNRNELPISPQIDLIDWHLRTNPESLWAWFERYSHADVIIVNSNSLLLDELFFKKEKLKNSLGMKSWNEKELFFNALSLNFSPSQEILESDLVKKFISFRTSQPFVVGVQMRFGGWGSWDDPALMHPKVVSYAPKAINELKKKLGRSNVAIYFCSDNGEVKEKVKYKISDMYNFFSFDEKPMHFERSFEMERRDFDFVCAEHLCLSMCDYIVTGKGDYGVTAAYRGKVPFIKLEQLVDIPQVFDLLCCIENKKKKFLRKFVK